MLRRTSSIYATTKSVADIPIPGGAWPIIGHIPVFVKHKNPRATYKHFAKECGEIFQVKLPTMPNGTGVMTTNPDHAKTVMMGQGDDAFRVPIHEWDRSLEYLNLPIGIPTVTGERWKTYRKVLNHTLLQPSTSRTYIPAVIPAANRLTDCIESYLDNERRCTMDLRKLYGMFALEAVLKVVLGIPYVGLKHPIPAEAQHFIQSVEDMFTNTQRVQQNIFAKVYTCKAEKDLRKNWKQIYDFPAQFILPVLQQYRDTGKIDAEFTTNTVFPLLVKQMEAGELNEKELIFIGCQAVTGAVDTTSQTIEFLLYNLARNPHVQDKIVAESQKIRPGLEAITDLNIEEYESLAYLRAAVKESMRLSPTVGMHIRTLVKDAVLGEYTIPKGTAVMVAMDLMGHDGSNYSDPDKYLPERFLRGCPQRGKQHPYTHIPFGHGARKCPGSGFAQLDLHLGLLALIRRFKVEYDGPDLEIVERQLHRSKEPLDRRFKFVSRTTEVNGNN